MDIIFRIFSKKYFLNNVSLVLIFIFLFVMISHSFPLYSKKEEVEKKSVVEKTQIKEKLTQEINKNNETKKDSTSKNIIKKEGVRKQKKFPILLVAAGVAVIVGIVLLLGKKKDEKETNILANEVYDSIKWQHIPSGEFEMGDNFNEGYPGEKPVHTVYLDSYYMSKYLISFDQYDKFCEDTNRSKPREDPWGWGRSNMPVIYVSWYNAQDFCKWLSEKTGHTIKLPTEAQWEKAARGTDQRRYPWGNEPPYSNLCQFGNRQNLPVDFCQLGVSPYGVHDMEGNILQICSDFYDEFYYSVSPKQNPLGPLTGTDHVMRGSVWYEGWRDIRSASRSKLSPNTRAWDIGFRIVKID